MEAKVVFNQSPKDNLHYRKLRAQLKQVLKSLPEKRKLEKGYMAFILLTFYLIIYLLAVNYAQSMTQFYGLYALLGITSVLIFINIIHDAVHYNVFKKRWMNDAILSVFDLMGGNSYIWKKRHVLLHHNFQNIAGWDSDIEQSGLIKIFKHEKPSWINRNQSWLIFFLYPMYLSNWILIRDFKDYFIKNRDIKKVCKIPVIEYFKLFFFKALFIFYLVIIPVILGFNLFVVLGALFTMFAIGSVFALLSLLTPHVNEKNQFPLPDTNGQLEVSWFEHQFITTNDVSLNNWFTRNFMGNFNFHLAHHLFPNISSVYAPEMTSEIRKYAEENGFEYRSYKLRNALYYHYKLIKANANNEDFFEEDM
jgi:linoleoyl-CoA desaturase